MKRLSLIIFFTIPFFLKAQTVDKQIVKVDTIPGHGYEIMYVGDPEKRRINLNGQLAMGDCFGPVHYNWPDAKVKIDSIYNLKQNWRLATTAQLRTIYTITQAIMDKKRIRVAGFGWQGISGLYWCNNSPDGSFNDLDNLAVAGSQNNREFEVSEGSGSDFATSDWGHGLKYKEQLLMVRKY